MRKWDRRMSKYNQIFSFDKGGEGGGRRKDFTYTVYNLKS